MADARGAPEGSAKRLLQRAVDRHGNTALAWTARPSLDVGRVLDLCCGDEALAAELPLGRWLGVDRDAGPRRPRLHAIPTALPLRRSSVDGICLSLVLPRLRDLERVFAELRRVLRPGGTLVVLVPSALPGSLLELRTGPLLAAVHRRGWRNRSALDQTGWLLAMADFAVLDDGRVSFGLPLPDAAAAYALAADLPRAGLWPPHLDSAALVGLAERLAARSGPDRVLPVPMRRLVARR